jgi:N-acyl-D-glutamate deacylase
LNESSFNELRAKNPGAIVVVHFYELPRDQKLLDMAVLFPGGIIASDAMPWISTRTGQEIDPNVWPLPDDAFSHPRSAGTFTRFLGQYVRDRKLMSWTDAIAKTSYLPAKLLEETAPQMKKKGRLQVGMDPDITVFDPATIQDRATYERPNQTSVGVKDLLVNGASSQSSNGSTGRSCFSFLGGRSGCQTVGSVPDDNRTDKAATGARWVYNRCRFRCQKGNPG